MPSVALNPVSNTGLERQSVSSDTVSVGIDWLQFILEFQNDVEIRNFIDYLGGYFNDTFLINWGCRANHGRIWEHSGKSFYGSAFAFDVGSAGTGIINRPRLWVSLCSATLNQVSKKVIPFIKKMVIWGATFTRMDIAVDDYAKRLPPHLIVEASDAGNVAGFKTLDPRFPRSVGSNAGEGGWTIYMGSPQSEKRVRYYNKAVESKGALDCYRWEAQFRGKYAQAIAHTIKSYVSDDEQGLSAYLSSIALGAVDFVDRSDAERYSRCDRLSWWADFVNAISGAVRIALPKVKNSIQKTLDWISSQVETSLAMLYEYFGGLGFDEYLLERLNKGRKRFNLKHLKILEMAQ